MTSPWKKPGDREASESHVEDFNAVSHDSEFHRLEARTIGEAGL